MATDIEYSKKYNDDKFEYRHVILPKEVAKRLPEPQRLLSETEWRSLGVQQSLGWIHYEIHRPEPHILLFRRPVGTDPRTGGVGATTVAAAPIVAATAQQQPSQVVAVNANGAAAAAKENVAPTLLQVNGNNNNNNNAANANNKLKKKASKS